MSFPVPRIAWQSQKNQFETNFILVYASKKKSNVFNQYLQYDGHCPFNSRVLLITELIPEEYNKKRNATMPFQNDNYDISDII